MKKIQYYSKLKNVLAIVLTLALSIAAGLLFYLEFPGDPQKAINSSLKLMEATLEKGLKTKQKTAEIPSLEEIREEINIETHVFSEKDPLLNKIEIIASSLCQKNEEILIAKYLVTLDQKPENIWRSSWQDRFINSKKGWKILERNTRLYLSIAISVASLFSFFIFLLIFYLISFVWYFSLARINEISLSIQGKFKD